MTGRKVRAPEKTLAVVDHNVPTSDRSKGIDDPESALQVATLAENATRVRHRVLPRARPPPGHRACGRPRAGLHASRHHHRLRRFAHLDPRRLRRAGARHRHERGRARARHPDADPEEGQEHARARRRRAEGRRHRQGHHPRHHRRDRHRRRHRPRHRICRRGDRSALHGRAHDHLQHVDRGRRPRRPDRARRQDLRIHQGPPARAEGRRLRDRAPPLADALFRQGRRLRQRDRAACREAAAARHLGHEPGAGGFHLWPRAAPGGDRRRDEAHGRDPLARLYGSARRREDHRPDARPRVHRLLHQRPHRGSARSGEDRRRQARARQCVAP